MSHATYTQGNQGGYWLLMVGNQIDNLTLNLSFGHNVCFKCPNGSCKPILNLYVLRSFQWYKELFNPMGFDPCNCSLKIRESIETPTPKVRVQLGVWRFILPRAWNVTFDLHTWPTPLQAFALVASPRLGLQHFVSSFHVFPSLRFFCDHYLKLQHFSIPHLVPFLTHLTYLPTHPLNHSFIKPPYPTLPQLTH
jgi:hypothetical protein